MPPAAVAAASSVSDDVVTKEDRGAAMMAWFRSEFAAANAMIDALCGHIAEISGGGGEGSEYERVFKAIHGRRMNWIPVIQMQKYQSIGDVRMELKRVIEKKVGVDKDGKDNKVVVNDVSEEDSLKSDVTDSGSQEVHHALENMDANICANHQECESRPAQIKLIKGFSAKELVKGHMSNVVKGLKLYEDVFTESELSKLMDFVNELRVAGQNGELSGQSFILINKQMKGAKREMIQFGVPIFGQIKEEATDNKHSVEETIPALLQGVIDHLVQWHILPEHRKPNSCIINFFDEGEYSQPFLKPPHLELPISTLLLSESTVAYGRTLASDSEGNYKAPLSLPLKKGSLLVMRGNSADMAGHAMCTSPTRRISITFFKVRPDSSPQPSPVSPSPTNATALWQPGMPTSYAVENTTGKRYQAMDTMPDWGMVPAPVIMLAPVSPLVLSPSRIPGGGTGVYLPSNVESRKPIRHLPPRAQKGRALAQASQAGRNAVESSSD